MMDLILRLSGERTIILVEHKMKLVMGYAAHRGIAGPACLSPVHAAAETPSRHGALFRSFACSTVTGAAQRRVDARHHLLGRQHLGAAAEDRSAQSWPA